MRPNIDDSTCSPRKKLVITVLVIIHLLAVLAQPLRFFSRRASGEEGPEFVWLSNWMRPYSQWLYLDHGYFFFAPNPGPGHLVQYRFTSGGGDDLTKNRTETSSITGNSGPEVGGLFPDRFQHRPRLLYHRYFMLSEFYHSRFAPTQVSEELKKDPEFLARWNYDSHIYRQLQTSIKRSLSHSRGQSVAELARLERGLPDPAEILQEGRKLTDPRFLIVLPEFMDDGTGSNNEALPEKPKAEALR